MVELAQAGSAAQELVAILIVLVVMAVMARQPVLWVQALAVVRRWAAIRVVVVVDETRYQLGGAASYTTAVQSGGSGHAGAVILEY